VGGCCGWEWGECCEEVRWFLIVLRSNGMDPAVISNRAFCVSLLLNGIHQCSSFVQVCAITVMYNAHYALTQSIKSVRSRLMIECGNRDGYLEH
jgi:hypothetical protein